MRIVIKNTSQSRSLYIPGVNGDLTSQQSLEEDDIPIPTLPAAQTQLINFGGITNIITLTGVISDCPTSSEMNITNQDLSLGTNGSGAYNTTTHAGYVKLMFPDQWDYVQTYFPTSNVADIWEIDIVDDTLPTPSTLYSYQGLITQFTFTIHSGSTVADFSIQFEQGQNMAQ